MGVIIALEHRFARTPDGRVWAGLTSSVLGHDHWRRYLRVFGEVRVLARVLDVAAERPGWRRVDGQGVRISAVPYYVGPREYLVRRHSVRRAVRDALASRPEDAVILRVPGAIGGIAADWMNTCGRPFGVEVVGDPHDVFAPGAISHPLRPLFRWRSTRALRQICEGAASALYVTESALQKRYPPSRAPGAAAFAVSDVDIGDDAFVAAPRRADSPAGPPFRVVTVGTLQQRYKAPDLLIEAVSICARQGTDVELAIVGDGRHRSEFEALAARLGVAARVTFTGRLPAGAAVRQELDRAHLFVLPSRTEGLPRAMLEAMARGLPCLATPVGGVPELLPPEALVPRDAGLLASAIRAVASDAALRERMSSRNLRRARDFHDDELQPRRERFHEHLVNATASWGASRMRAAPAT